MSKFNSSSSFFKRNSTQQLNITTKVSQKLLKNNKKTEKNNSCSNISDNDFDKLMEENDNPKTTYSNKPQAKLSSYLDKITSPDVLTQLVMEDIKGDEFLTKIKYKDFTASQILGSILKKYHDPNNWNWITKEEYGEVLSNLLEDNFDEQLLCLLLVQNHCIQIDMPKISHKDKDVYYIKLIFQLMFTQDIIDETVYWKWYELLSKFTDVNDETKNKLCIQTTEFFNILKMTFTEEDYENNEGDEGDAGDEEKNNNHNNNNEDTTKQETDSEQEMEIEDKYKVPEEQDWNMDDI